LITECGEYCKESVQNTHHRSGRNETATVKGVPIWIMSLRQLFVSGFTEVQISDACLVHLPFRWGRKRLHDFAANLFRKLCTIFHQHRSSFVEDITKNSFVSFSGHSVQW